jgi:hypothetical protein
MCRVENEDVTSEFFDLKWTLKTKHIPQHQLHDCQQVNHFARSFSCLTTKVGLLKALHDTRWYYPATQWSMHPRTYNLSLEDDWEAFHHDFRFTAAASILRAILRDGGFHPSTVPSEGLALLALQACRERLAQIRYDDLIKCVDPSCTARSRSTTWQLR